MENKEKAVETNVSTDNENNTETVNDPVDDAVREKKSIKKASNKKVITLTSICVIVVAIIILVFSLNGCTGCTTSVSSTTPIASASSKVTASASPTPSATPSATPTTTPTDTPEPTTAPEEATADNGQTAVTPVQPAQSNSNSGCTVVHHEATGHYETKVVSAAYDEQVLVTPAQDTPIYAEKVIVQSNGHMYNSTSEWDNSEDSGKAYRVEKVQTGTNHVDAVYSTVHHDAVTNQVWVVDSNAYDTCE